MTSTVLAIGVSLVIPIYPASSREVFDGKKELFDPEEFRERLLKMASVQERPQWQRFLERRSSWPLDEERLRQGQVQPQSQLMPPLPPKRMYPPTLASHCWSPDWSPSDCCFFSPPDTALTVCFANNTAMFMECCPWETVEEMQASILSCDLSKHSTTWKQLQQTFAQCLGSGDESCIPKVAREVPLFEDPLCAMGEALRGIFLSANKPYNEMMDSNAILPDGKMHGFDECLLHGLDQARCCVRTRFCKCASHPADRVGCNLGVAVECAICLMLIPSVLLRHSGWGLMFSWILQELQSLSLDRQGLTLEPEPSDPLRSLTYSSTSAPGHQHRDLLRMSNASGPLGERLVGTVIEDFFTQAMATATPLDAWARAVETGLISGLARFLGRRQLPPRRSALPTAQLQGVARLIPKNLASLVPGRLMTQGARAKALREMMGPARLERQKGGMLEAAWLQSLRSWPHRCCPPDATGALALLHPPPAGLSKWPGLLLALCLACESRDQQLLKQVERGIFCSGSGCGMLMRLQMVEQHAWNVWKDPAAKRFVPFLQLILERFNKAKVARVTGATEMKVMSTAETLSFIKAGGSMARFGDGEFWSMDRASITPVVCNRMLQESLVYVARLGASGCPGFKPAMVDVLGPPESFPDQENYDWWRERHFFRQIPYRYFPPGNYGNMWVNYRPGEAIRRENPTAMLRFVEGWEEVFLNKSVLLVGHPFAQAATEGHATGVMFAAAKADYNFPVRVAQLSWEMMREVASQRLPPFSRARDVRLMRPLAIGLASSVRWYSALDTVREVVDNSDIDVVAVSWGPQAKPLVADIACRGTQAVDVGRLLWELHGISAMAGDLLKDGAP